MLGKILRLATYLPLPLMRTLKNERMKVVRGMLIDILEEYFYSLLYKE